LNVTGVDTSGFHVLRNDPSSVRSVIVLIGIKKGYERSKKLDADVFRNNLERFYQGFNCGVKVNYDTCHECEHFVVRSGWGEYCIASEDFARVLTASLKSWGILK
jgi:hypothetical protein